MEHHNKLHRDLPTCPTSLHTESRQLRLHAALRAHDQGADSSTTGNRIASVQRQSSGCSAQISGQLRLLAKHIESLRALEKGGHRTLKSAGNCFMVQQLMGLTGSACHASSRATYEPCCGLALQVSPDSEEEAVVTETGAALKT